MPRCYIDAWFCNAVKVGILSNLQISITPDAHLYTYFVIRRNEAYIQNDMIEHNTYSYLTDFNIHAAFWSGLDTSIFRINK